MASTVDHRVNIERQLKPISACSKNFYMRKFRILCRSRLSCLFSMILRKKSKNNFRSFLRVVFEANATFKMRRNVFLPSLIPIGYFIVLHEVHLSYVVLLGYLKKFIDLCRYK